MKPAKLNPSDFPGHFGGSESFRQLLYWLNRLHSSVDPDSCSPTVLRWVNDGTVEISAAPGQPSTMALVLSDGKQRSFDGVLSLSPASDLDVGSEAPDTVYYPHAVPDPADDDAFIGKLSVSSINPTGFPISKYLGAVINDGSSDLIKFSQIGPEFFIHDRVEVENFADPIVDDVSPVAVALANFVPLTAGIAMFAARMRAQVGAAGTVYFYVDGSEAVGHHDFIQVEAGATNMQRRIVMPLPQTPRRIFRKIDETAGDLSLYQLHLIGWVDENLV